jgi:GTP-binding protein
MLKQNKLGTHNKGGKNMIVKNPMFEISAVSPKQYPNNDLPQIVLVGKSNVGKSSFINTMINRKKLARTSSEPGKTRQINFYNIDNYFYFVDLPGYGYSKMSKTEQIKVGKFIEQYLVSCKNISLIVFLLDIRHAPTENDKLMYNYIISSGLPFIILANKADKIAVTKVANATQNLQKALNPIGDIPTFAFSSERKIYQDDIWEFLEPYLKK